MWYKTKEEAEEACKLKEVEFGREFFVEKDSEKEDCWWAVRGNSRFPEV